MKRRPHLALPDFGCNNCIGRKGIPQGLEEARGAHFCHVDLKFVLAMLLHFDETLAPFFELLSSSSTLERGYHHLERCPNVSYDSKVDFLVLVYFRRIDVDVNHLGPFHKVRDLSG